MAPRSSWCAVFLLLYTNICFAIDSSCDSSADTGNALMCESLFKTFENALLSNGSNLYKLKKLFHTNPPELASIIYYLELESNWLNNSDIDDFEGSGTSGALPLCSCAGSSIFNRTMYMYDDNATIRLRYGWTTIGVYSAVGIHPALLNQLQIQLPFTIMRLIVTDGSPFLWDGHNQLPSTNLHLFIPTNNLSCIPCNSQLDGVMKTLTSLLAFYTRSERRLSDSYIPIDADYALDGLYVSNWTDAGGGSTNIVPQAEILNSGLLIVQCILGSTPTLFVTAFLFAIIFRILNNKKTFQVVTQSSALLDGFIFCIFLFGITLLATELFAYWNAHNPHLVVQFKFYYILLFLIVKGSPLLCFYSDFARGEKCYMLCASLLQFMLMTSCCFVLEWAIISSFATILLSLAYPLHVTTLVVLHFTFVFALSVTFGVFVLNSKDTQNFFYKYFTSCFFTLVIAIPLYITLIVGYAFTIVQHIVPADGLIKGLLFLPSVILFLIGWLLNKRFFDQNDDQFNDLEKSKAAADKQDDQQIQAVLPLVVSSQKAKKLVAEIVHLNFTIKKRAELGKHLGIPSSELHDIELKAMEKDNTKEEALTEIIRSFFDNNQLIATWATIMDIVENKMGMSVTDVYEDRVTEGVVSQLGSCVEEIDIQWILHQLEPSIPKIVAELVTHRTTADDRTKLKCFLQDWISQKKEDATWCALIRKIATIDEQAAKKIRTIRCPADQEQDTTGDGTSENSSIANGLIDETSRLL